MKLDAKEVRSLKRDLLTAPGLQKGRSNEQLLRGDRRIRDGVCDLSRAAASASQGPHRHANEADFTRSPGGYDGLDECVKEDIARTKAARAQGHALALHILSSLRFGRSPDDMLSNVGRR